MFPLLICIQSLFGCGWSGASFISRFTGCAHRSLSELCFFFLFTVFRWYLPHLLSPTSLLPTSIYSQVPHFPGKLPPLLQMEFRMPLNSLSLRMPASLSSSSSSSVSGPVSGTDRYLPYTVRLPSSAYNLLMLTWQPHSAAAFWAGPDLHTSTLTHSSPTRPGLACLSKCPNSFWTLSWLSH